jgi:thaumarchaeosortase
MHRTKVKRNRFSGYLNISSDFQMKPKSYIKNALGKLSEVKKVRSHIVLASFLFIPIILILFLDSLNIEAITSFNQVNLFDLTWKGRMFYLFFMWLFLLETILDWEVIIEKERILRNRARIFLAFIFASVPTIYVLGVNFLGLNQRILDLSGSLHVRPEFVGDWALSVEYLVLISFFILAIWLVYGLSGLGSFSISLSLLAGMGVMYLVDTIWPYGTFGPMQFLTVPTAAFATGLLDILGYNVALTYPVSSPEYGSLPLMTVSAGGENVRASVAWPCAGVHSLLLFTLIILVFFKRTTMQRDRKIVFLLVGAAGTYLTNIFRIASFFTISVHHGSDAGQVFHNSYGELYFIAWMLLYFIIMIAIQSGKINRLAQAIRKRLKVFRVYGAD